MNLHEFDRILTREAEIEPSPGFVHSVMTAVRNEAAVPPRIRFPWLCLLPQLAVWCIAVVWVVIDSVHLPSHAPVISSRVGEWGEALATILMRAEGFGAGWVLLALVSTLLCLKLRWRISGWFG